MAAKPPTILYIDVAQKENGFGVWGFTWYKTSATLEKSFQLSDPQAPYLMKEHNVR